MFRPIWPSSCVKDFFVIGETSALVVVVAVMHTYPQERTRNWFGCGREGTVTTQERTRKWVGCGREGTVTTQERTRN
jgi:hypothetical protein